MEKDSKATTFVQIQNHVDYITMPVKCWHCAQEVGLSIEVTAVLPMDPEEKLPFELARDALLPLFLDTVKRLTDKIDLLDDQITGQQIDQATAQAIEKIQAALKSVE